MTFTDRQPRLVVVAPTYNNARTVRDVVEAIVSQGLAVIVVNDGSTDGTAEILEALGGNVTIVTHSKNAGKAAAMRAGFANASELAFTHALTIDTDAQHDPADIPELIAAHLRYPEAMIIGTRQIDNADYPAASRVGRLWSNRFVRLESGLCVNDSQCGLRIYPLNVTRLPARADRYGYETEILTRCGWAHVNVIEVPIRTIYAKPEQRVTHFRPWSDSASAFGMHSRLLTRSMLPWRAAQVAKPDDQTRTGTIFERMIRWFSPMRAWRSIRNDEVERKRFAVAIAIGVFIANMPLYGLHTMLSLIAARKWRLNPLAVVTGSKFSTPPIGPFLIAIAIVTGHWLLNGRWLQWSDLNPAETSYVDLLRRTAADWALGSLVCGIGFAAISYLLVRAILLILPRDGEPNTVATTQIAEA